MRIKKYRHKTGKFFARWLFVILALSVAANFIWNMLIRMEIFGLDVDAVGIHGNNMVSDNRVFEILSLDYGRNIFLIDTDELKHKLESLDRVKKAAIKLDFPDSFNIIIAEVQPVGYLMKDSGRYVVTYEGTVFPGLEGPAIKFKVTDPLRIKKLARLLVKIKEVDMNFYNDIIAVDLDFADRIIIHTRDFYLKWQESDYVDEAVIERNTYIMRKTLRQYGEKPLKYIDLRFIKIVAGKVKGSVLVK